MARVCVSSCWSVSGSRSVAATRHATSSLTWSSRAHLVGVDAVACQESRNSVHSSFGSSAMRVSRRAANAAASARLCLSSRYTPT
ncbi:MAG TPA: hypothetical protein VNO31_21880 [Umezawaea sp.]|nr:hypothetical protein [Umezawaea sp.]